MSSRPTAGSARSTAVGPLRRRLLQWYTKNRRDLPWRQTRDPYAIWISETMLQQTRVDTVIPYYERFLDRFPDIEALASADQDDVYGHWAGLGYYSRARNLQAAARSIVERFGGQLPSDPEDLRSLPGVGRYTSGAIASIAFDRPEPVVDGNVARVLARILGLREDIASPPVVARLWDEAAALARGSRPGDLNQALMELGATLCTPRSPRCDACPVAQMCDAHRQGDAQALPVKRKKTKPRQVFAAAAWLERGGKLLLVRKEAGGLLGGLWGPPMRDLDEPTDPADTLRSHIASDLGLEFSALEALGSVGHVFSHRSLQLHVFRVRVTAGRVRSGSYEAHRWVSPSQLALLPTSALTDKALLQLQSARAPAKRAASKPSRHRS